MKLSTKYIENKQLFLKEMKYAESTQKTFLVMYKKYIEVQEVKNKKDLLFFKETEFDELMENVNLSANTMKLFKSYISKYLEWGFFINGKYLNVNFYPKKYENDFSMDWFINLDDFYEMCESMSEKTNIVNIIPLILGRYGITGDGLNHMINLKWGDINEIEKVVLIKDEGKILKIPVDDEFIKWANDLKPVYENIRDKQKLIKEYVLKVENDHVGKGVSYHGIYNRHRTVFEQSGFNRINFKDMYFSRIIDLLLENHKNKNDVTYEEIGAVMKIFGEDYQKKMTTVQKIKNGFKEIKSNKAKPKKLKQNEVRKNRKEKAIMDEGVPEIKDNVIVVEDNTVNDEIVNEVINEDNIIVEDNVAVVSEGVTPYWIVKEVWLDVPNYEGIYQISNFGNARCVDVYLIKQRHNVKTRKRIAPAWGVDGSVKIYLTKDKKSVYIDYARLVYKTFHPEFDIDNLDIPVYRKDGDILNNSIENLYIREQ